MKINEIVDVISVLVSPNGDENSTSQSEVFMKSLLKNMQNVEECLIEEKFDWIKTEIQSECLEHLDDTNSIRVNFVGYCIKLLLCLKKHLLIEKNSMLSDSSLPPPDILSIQQQKIVSSCVQFVIGLGIIPSLMPGVGICHQQRENYTKLISSEEETNSSLDKYKHLFQCTLKLIDCMEHSTLAEIISPHVNNIMASLIQLSNIPIKLTCDASNLEQNQFILQCKGECRKKLSFFMNKLPQITLIKELLVLQGNKQVPVPLWFVKSVSKLLSQQLLRPQGVLSVTCAILNTDEQTSKTDLEVGNFDWKKCEIIAKLIVQCRLPNQSTEEYFSIVGPEILKLLKIKNDEGNNPFTKVLVEIFRLATNLYEEDAKKKLWLPLLKPLYDCSQELENSSFTDKSEIIGEITLTDVIQYLYEFFILTSNINRKTFQFLRPVIAILFHLFVFSRSTVSHLKKKLHSLITQFLLQIDQTSATTDLKALLFNENIADEFLLWNVNLIVENGSYGGLRVVHNAINDELYWLNDLEERANAIIEILYSLQKNNCVSSFFLSMLEEFTEIQIQRETKAEAKHSNDRKLLLEIEENVTQEQNIIKKSLLLINMLDKLSGDTQLQDSVLQDKNSSLKFLEMTFVRAAQQCNEMDENFGVETLTTALTLAILLLSKQLTQEEKNLMKNLVPHLEKLSNCHLSENVRQMSNELRIAILTEGLVMREDSKQKSNQLSEFQKAMHELKDPFLPVRGHALISLKRLISVKDKETLLHKEELLAIFKTNLDHDDTYIYLNAIQGLASLANHFSDEVISCLTSEFADYDKKRVNQPEIRLKMGEILVKVTQDLGEMLPKYKEYFLRAFLSGCKDNDSHVRASSLSNLGELCKGLRFSIGSCLYEIISCIESLLQTDPNVEVKEACLLVITLMLRGLGKDVFQAMDDVILNLYRLVKKEFSLQNDEKIKLHAQLALEELNIIVKEFLSPKSTLSKEIRIFN